MKRATWRIVLIFLTLLLILRLSKRLVLNTGMVVFQSTLAEIGTNSSDVIDNNRLSRLNNLEEIFSVITESYSGNNTAWFGLGYINYLQGDKTSSHNIWNSEIYDRDTLYKVGEFYESQSKFDQALEIYNHAVTKPGNIGLSTLYFKIGYLNQFHRSQKDLLSATLAYENAVEIGDFRPEAWRETEAYNFLGNIYLEKGDLTAASKYYSLSLVEKEDQYWTLVNYARVLWKMGKLSDAEEALNRAISIDTTISDAYLNKARILLEQGYLHEANISYQEVIRIDPNNEEANNALEKLNE